MSSTERAPEPTMEEILASIRRIISDEEAAAPQEAAPPAEDDYPVRAPSADADYEVADTQIIDDIARVLSGGAPADAPLEEEEILDLDLDLGDALDLGEPVDLSSADEILLVEETVVEETVIEETVVIESAAPYEPRTPDFSAAFPSSASAASEFETAESRMDEAIEAEAADEQFEPDSPGVYEPFAVEEVVVVAAPPPPALEETTSALERAIAALKAGDLSAFAREADSPSPYGFGASPAAKGGSAPVATAPFEAAPAPVPESEPSAQAHPVIAAEDEPLALDELVEIEPTAWQPEETLLEMSEPVVEAELEAEPEQEPETTAAWMGEDTAWSKPQPTPIKEFLPNGTRTNGGASHKQHHEFEAPVVSKSLEDSVKEMLRPMLRQWLDENMNRVLTAALREELDNPPAPNTRRGN